MSDSTPLEHFSSDGITSAIDSGNFSCYDSRNKSPIYPMSDKDTNKSTQRKLEHLYVNAPPKPFRCNASPCDESFEELPSADNIHPYYRRPNVNDHYRNQLRTKADALFPDVTRDCSFQRSMYPQTQKYSEKPILNTSYGHNPSTGSSECGYRSHVVVSSPCNAPALPKKGIQWPHENNNSMHMMSQLEEMQVGANMCDKTVHTPERSDHASRPINQGSRDGRYTYTEGENDIPAGYSNKNDRAQILRENHARSSTRSLGNAASRGRPSSHYQTNESRERPARQLTRDDSFTVNMEKGYKHKAEQREASMKRLLEWKQRMLHSPLSRNHRKLIEVAPADSPPQRPPLPDGYHEQVLMDLVKHENAALRTINKSEVVEPSYWQPNQTSRINQVSLL